MHTWYHAVCDECKEECVVLVTSTFHIRPDYVTDNHEESVVKFLDRHYNHALRLVHRDQDLEELGGYKDVYRDRKRR